MKISPNWLRDFVDLKVDERKLADDLTHAGIAVEAIAQESGQTVFEMEITTNRVDAMNHYGVAREASAIYDLLLKALAPKLPAGKGTADFPIAIEDATGCARYTARIIRGVKIGPTPENILHRLKLLGHNGVSNAVDASNYTLEEMGHPTHAFDMDKLEGGKLVIRRARAGEKLVTLDGVERKLTADDLVIADAKKPVALAGIMGGDNSKVTDATKNLLIESAWFDPVTIRKTARRLGMHTDASHRFERGADWGATSLACARVAELILESAGGELVGDEMDVIARHIERKPVLLRRSEVRRHLGQELPEKDIERILTHLGFRVTAQNSHEAYTIELPTWRLDIEREIDLIEELARVYGYNNFRNTLPSFAGAVIEAPDAARDARIRGTLLALGYNEAISLTFISEAEAKQFLKHEPVPLENPLSEEASVMRTALAPRMLEMLAHNLNRGQDNVRLFEAGNVFAASPSGFSEHKQVALGATASALSANSTHSGKPLEMFRAFKGDVEAVLSAFPSDDLSFEAGAAAYFHPGRSARTVIDGKTVAQFGQVHPDVINQRKLKQDVYLAEFFLDELYRHELRQARYVAASKFPAVERDFSFIFDDAVLWEQVHDAVEGLKIAELTRVEAAEIFRPEKNKQGSIPTGKYSLLTRVVFQSNERTLRDEEVTAWSNKIVKALQALGGTIRA